MNTDSATEEPGWRFTMPLLSNPPKILADLDACLRKACLKLGKPGGPGKAAEWHEYVQELDVLLCAAGADPDAEGEEGEGVRRVREWVREAERQVEEILDGCVRLRRVAAILEETPLLSSRKDRLITALYCLEEHASRMIQRMDGCGPADLLWSVDAPDKVTGDTVVPGGNQETAASQA